MKKIMKLVGIFVIALVMVFFTTGCGSDSVSGDSDYGPVTVTLNSIKVNQYPIHDTDELDGTIVDFYSLYPTERNSISNVFEDAVSMVSNGKLTLNLGIPQDALSTLSDKGFPDSIYTNDAKTLFISYFRLFHDDTASYYNIFLNHKSNATVYVMLVYAEEATEIHGPVLGATYFHVKLQQGWNTLLGDQVGVVSNVTVDTNYEWVM